ncbi:MAG: alpha/beta hydrolase [Planctomycetaceae bacterium]|nr:alpha/beta hydrolase [Planctomycetales bacterium]MCB9941010.1 alpha/beta hydrolase [Planctomycetaceae bacterium]
MSRNLLIFGLILASFPFSSLGDEVGGNGLEIPAVTVEGPTFGGKQLWTDELIFHDWRIQRHTWTGHYRLLDDKDYRRAWGSFEHCNEQLESLKQELGLPPMRGRVVVALHGLLRTRESMQGICDYFHEHGDYTIVNFSYASTRNELDQHARSFARVMEHMGPKVTEINLVAHSLGNLVIRHYLGDQTNLAQGKRPDPRIHRIVMLAPPNNGAEFARKFADNKIFQTIWGKTGLELANEWETLEPRLAVPACEFAVIAGGKGEPSGSNPLLTGDDDFVVSVEETRLPGARDFRVLPVLHSSIMDDETVRECALKFFWHGYLVAEDLRQPIPRAPVNVRLRE